MKRHISLLISAGLVMSSCAVSEIEDSNFSDNTAKAIYATTESGTKTSIGSHEDGIYKVFWSEDDKILLADGKGNTATYSIAEGGSTSAVFFAEDGAEDLDFTDGVIAGYPDDGNFFISSSDPEEPVYFTIPSEQVYTEGTFGENVMPMISEVSYDNQLKFRNAAGVLKLMLSSASEVNVKTITVSSTEMISGECGYVPESMSYFFDESMISKKSVTLSCGEGVAIGADAKAFYIVVPHQEYKSLSITVTSTDGNEKTFTMKEGKVLNVQRSAVLNLPIELGDLKPAGPDVELTLNSTTFKSINVSISIKNAEAYFCSLQTKEDFERDIESGNFLESIPYSVKYDKMFNYKGSITGFNDEMKDLYLEPGETYILWVVVYDESGEYTEEDIHTLEIKMKSYTPGGTATVSAELDEEHTSYDRIRLNVNSSGFMYVYCDFISEEMLNGFSSDQEAIEFLIRPGSKASRYEKLPDTFERASLRPGTERVFIAVAVDIFGKYGPLYKNKYSTKTIDYSPMTVEIEKDDAKVTETAKVSWNTSNGKPVEYIYYLCGTSERNWTNTHMADYIYVQEQITLLKMMGQTNYRYTSTTDNFIDLKTKLGKATGTEYILIVLGVAEDGRCSEADHWTFTY